MDRPSIRDSAREYGRGVVGGLIFSLPLLYTMEVWQTGFVASPGRLLVGLVATFGLLLLYNRYAGLHEDVSKWEVAIDSVEELALGLIVATLTLKLTGRLSEGDGVSASLGKIGICGMMSAIGVSVGTAQLGAENPQKDRKPHFSGQIAIAMCGSFLVAGNVAPTEEIERIAFAATPGALVGILLLSLLVAGVVTGVGDFRVGRAFSDNIPVPEPIFAAVVSGFVALAVSAGMVAFFGGFEGNGVYVVLAQTVVLGLPAALGASAGRLLLQT
ncbi:DUF2391 family protein [bacterium]|nr:MAG: DUF2391 family protein [bacterium]